MTYVIQDKFLTWTVLVQKWLKKIFFMVDRVSRNTSIILFCFSWIVIIQRRVTLWSILFFSARLYQSFCSRKLRQWRNSYFCLNVYILLMGKLVPTFTIYKVLLFYWKACDKGQIFIFMSWAWLYGSWIYNYLCCQYLSPLKLWVRTLLMARWSRYNIMW